MMTIAESVHRPVLAPAVAKSNDGLLLIVSLDRVLPQVETASLPRFDSKATRISLAKKS